MIEFSEEAYSSRDSLLDFCPENCTQLRNDEKIEEMEQWSAEDFAAYICPKGTMTLEEFDDLLTKRITELWKEKYGSD